VGFQSSSERGGEEDSQTDVLAGGEAGSAVLDADLERGEREREASVLSKDKSVLLVPVLTDVIPPPTLSSSASLTLALHSRKNRSNP
jgi:hypothetical protein